MPRKQIAVLGGGVGAMTTAFYLTSVPGWRERYDVTVYQMGWRLGGKGASGRNRDRGDRIEEHGLHLFFGFYENAFATMQRLYRELGRPAGAPLARWDQAWQPHSRFVLEEDLGDRTELWPFEFPTNGGVPGQGGDLATPWQMLQILLGWAREIFEATSAAPPRPTVTSDRLDGLLDRAIAKLTSVAAVAAPLMRDLRLLFQAVAGVLSDVPEALIANTFLHAAEHHAKRQPDDAHAHERHDHDVILWLLREFVSWLKGHWAGVRERTEIRRALIVIDALVATAVGMIADDLIRSPVDWFKIDHLRLEDWLVKHGAERSTVEAAPVLIFSELVFGRWAGVGAGTGLHYALRLVFTYKRAFAFKMQAGMGDTIFAPFYQVLSARGVRFEFFHAVDELATGRDADGAPVIDAITIDVQAETQGGAPYRPLVELGGLPCWPSEPLHDQLARGDELRRSGENLENWWNRWPAARTRVLRRGVDFDEVVLGISIGAYPYICKPLIAEMPAFARMVQAVQVTETQAAQLWLRSDFAQLGWSLGEHAVIGTCRDPFDTVADMSHVLPRERWPAGAASGIVYLTSQLPAGGPPPTPPRAEWRYPLDRRDRVWSNLTQWLDTRVAQVLPHATAPTGAFDAEVLVDPVGSTGPERVRAQFWTACWNPSDRYVLSVPGSVHARLPSAGTGYRNLVMAGDWTLTALSAGCAEAAVMSGMHASRALCGQPARIVGDELPDGDDLRPAAPPPARGRYIELDDGDTPLQPYTAQDVTMYSFLLEADLDRLQAICDQQLNLGGAIYRPVGPFVFFVASIMGSMAPVSPRGWLAEKDFGFWIPVVAGRRGGDGAFHAERPAFFIPYLWVDDFLPSQAGREVFGYPKAVGRLAHPASPGDAAELSIDALVIPELGPPGAPASRWQWRRLVTAARRGGDRWSGLAGDLGSIVELGRTVVASLVREIGDHALLEPTRALLGSLVRDTLALEVPMVFLKQFRDAADGRMACYQAIVESVNRMTHGPVGAGLLHGDWELAIAEFPTVRLIERLGLRVRPDGKVPALVHFWVKFAFTAEPGRVVWQVV
ncbi:MAG: hypothetical protein E6J91_43010 [Deltaproteobacteria bacterium]|nr:MAG: hypothetical protein E6J91_43010 [Deltaproteobacteria bacterium]